MKTKHEPEHYDLSRADSLIDAGKLARGALDGLHDTIDEALIDRRRAETAVEVARNAINGYVSEPPPELIERAARAKAALERLQLRQTEETARLQPVIQLADTVEGWARVNLLRLGARGTPADATRVTSSEGGRR